MATGQRVTSAAHQRMQAQGICDPGANVFTAAIISARLGAAERFGERQVRQKEAAGSPPRRRTVRQLKRLETLTDVIYGIVIWRLFMLFPQPTVGAPQWDTVVDMLVAERLSIALITIGIVVVIIYWQQSNDLLGSLEATDTWHTTFAILQLFFLLLFLHAIGIGVEFEAHADLRILESGTALLVGATSWLGWRHAVSKGGMLAADVSPKAAEALAIRALAEPLTAALTIPFAFAGPVPWELAWLAYLPISRWLRWRRTKLRG